MKWRMTYCFLLLLAALASLSVGAQEPDFDLVITGGTIIDGTGSAGFKADLGIKNGVITAIGPIPSGRGKRVIEAGGRYVVPGFIDIHTHGDNGILNEQGKYARNYLTQGVTTLVTGNCGSGTYNVASYFARMTEQGIGPNIVHLVGHGTVRSAVMGDVNRAPSAEEMKKMKILVEKAMQEGAAGMSTGLFYAPGSFAEVEEIIELCTPVKAARGFYASHIRDESDYSAGLKASIAEAIEVGEKAGIPVQISHIKALGKTVWGMSAEVCRLIEAAQARGVRVSADQYPYDASSTSLAAAVLPRWVEEGGRTRERLKDPVQLPRIKKEIAENIDRRGGADSMVLSSFRPRPEWEGMSLLEISRALQKSPVDAAVDIVLQGSASIVSFNMSEDDIAYFMKRPYVMTGSDGSIITFGQGVPHPRNYGSFVRKLRTYVFEKKIISLEQAVHAATGLPGAALGFRDRGLLKQGYAADIVVFNPETLADRATYTHPHQYCEGIDFVLVNGSPAVDGGAFKGVLAGKALRH